MGCDIHFYVERFTSENYPGPKNISEEREITLNDILDNVEKEERWVSVDNWVYEQDQYSDNPEDMAWEIPWGTNYYRGGNYYLFSLLADVRNYNGEVEPLSQPRGIPDDASYGYKYEVDKWDGDGHSHSYYTLEELLNVNWDLYNTGYYDKYLDEFLESIEKMKEIDSDPSKVRCVFFFDN